MYTYVVCVCANVYSMYMYVYMSMYPSPLWMWWAHHTLRTLPSAPSCCWPQKGNKSLPLETCQRGPQATLYEPHFKCSGHRKSSPQPLVIASEGLGIPVPCSSAKVHKKNWGCPKVGKMPQSIYGHPDREIDDKSSDRLIDHHKPLDLVVTCCNML